MSFANEIHPKVRAARAAVEFIESGMIVGLGTGSTAEHAVREIGKRITEGRLKDILGIPTSLQAEIVARETGVMLASLNECPNIDVTIDGADEVSRGIFLIKGGGGALLREKMVAQASKRNIIVVDKSKVSEHIGEKFALPVEVSFFGLEPEKKFLESLGAKVTQRLTSEGKPFVTDEHHAILDCRFIEPFSAKSFAEVLNNRAGIVGHGLFLGTTNDLLVGFKDVVYHITSEMQDKLDQLI